MIALGLPALLVAIWVLASLWREGGRVLRERAGEAAEYDEALRDEAELLASGVGASAR